MRGGGAPGAPPGYSTLSNSPVQIGLSEPISAEIRLATTLRYLAASKSQASLSFNYRLGRSTVCEVLELLALPMNSG